MGSASSPALDAMTSPAHPDEHPLGKSRAAIVRNYSVPTIPGYAGYIPAKYPENIHGGGILHSCKMANRAFSERLPPLDPEEDPPTGAANFKHTEDPEHRMRVTATNRAHCERPIPGYMGHVPRVSGESICGARFSHANAIAAEYCHDRYLGEPS